MTRPERAVAKQHDFDSRVRLFVYRHTIRKGRVPVVSEVAQALAATRKKVSEAFVRLSESHAFMLQDTGELWRAAPFSAIATAFPVRIGKRSWWGNCIWDALSIPAMLHKDAAIDAGCSCCKLRDATCHKKWKASATGRRDPYRGARPRLV